MEQFLDSFPVGYMYIRPEGSVAVNSAYERVTGYSRSNWQDPLSVAVAMHGGIEK